MRLPHDGGGARSVSGALSGAEARDDGGHEDGTPVTRGRTPHTAHTEPRTRGLSLISNPCSPPVIDILFTEVLKDSKLFYFMIYQNKISLSV